MYTGSLSTIHIMYSYIYHLCQQETRITTHIIEYYNLTRPQMDAEIAKSINSTVENPSNFNFKILY